MPIVIYYHKAMVKIMINLKTVFTVFLIGALFSAPIFADKIERKHDGTWDCRNNRSEKCLGKIGQQIEESNRLLRKQNRILQNEVQKQQNQYFLPYQYVPKTEPLDDALFEDLY